MSIDDVRSSCLRNAGMALGICSGLVYIGDALREIVLAIYDLNSRR